LTPIISKHFVFYQNKNSDLLKLYHSEFGTDTLIAELSCDTGFLKDSVKFQWIPLSNEVIERAQALLMKYGFSGLRTLDAIQLASALALKGQPKVRFFTADQLLKSFFEQEGLEV